MLYNLTLDDVRMMLIDELKPKQDIEYDEDEDAVEEIRALLLELKEKGVLIIITSHNREDIDVLCDEVYRIKKGKMLRELPIISG